MKIYIEFIFLINFLLDFMILYGTKRLLKRNTKVIRIILGSIIGSLTTNLLLINITSIELFIIKIILSLLIILITFGNKNIIENTIYFYLISIILGGVIYLFNLNINNYFYYLILITISPIIIYLLIKELKNYKLNLKNTYTVEIYYKNKKYTLEGFIDTGNRLKDPITKKDIILINKKLDIDKVIYVPYKALNYEGIIPCIKPEKVLIDNKLFNNCLIGISKDKFNINKYNCIIPNKYKEELCLN